MRRHLPALSHWFHLTPADLDRLPFSELEVYVAALKECPPVGSVFLVARKE